MKRIKSDGIWKGTTTKCHVLFEPNSGGWDKAQERGQTSMPPSDTRWSTTLFQPWEPNPPSGPCPPPSLFLSIQPLRYLLLSNVPLPSWAMEDIRGCLQTCSWVPQVQIRSSHSSPWGKARTWWLRPWKSVSQWRQAELVTMGRMVNNKLSTSW